MKTFRFLVVVILFAVHAQGQNIWIANNNFNAPAGSNVFATVQEAIDAASAGDIVQVQPSPTAYGNALIDKQITLVGIGFNVDKDIPLTSVLGQITLTNNVDNTSDADGTVIRGLQFGRLQLASEVGGNFVLENVLVQNCQLSHVYNESGGGFSNIDGLEIRDCFINSSIGGFSIYLYKHVTNFILRGNLIFDDIGFFSTLPGSNIITNNILYEGIRVDAEGSNTTILNNDFIASSGGDAAFGNNLRDCIVANNIFYGMTPSVDQGGGSTSTVFQRNVFTNNLVYSTGDDNMPPSGGGAGNSGSGNLVGSPLFVNVQLLNTWSTSYDFTLQGGSPAINAGSDGTDIGISGGSYPMTDPNFVLKTYPAPVIQILNTSTVINPGDDLPVRVKANAN